MELHELLRPTRHKIGHFGDALPSQSLGFVLKVWVNAKWCHTPISELCTVESWGANSHISLS